MKIELDSYKSIEENNVSESYNKDAEQFRDKCLILESQIAEFKRQNQVDNQISEINNVKMEYESLIDAIK